MFHKSIVVAPLPLLLSHPATPPPDKGGAVSDHQPGDGPDRLAARGHQVSPQRALPRRPGERQPADVPAGSVGRHNMDIKIVHVMCYTLVYPTVTDLQGTVTLNIFPFLFIIIVGFGKLAA